MDIFGIKNITDKELEFDYDKHYKKIALHLKMAKTDEERNEIRRIEQEKLSSSNSIEIDFKVLKENFIKLILDENSSKYLWILYSKYDGKENYIDKISEILKKENTVTRGGANTYKMNGWMAHTLYVYQISNYNIPNNKGISNFNGNEENKKQVEELNKLYCELNNESKFILKIYALIHDIGVIEDMTYHDKLGGKYVKKVLEEIGLTEQELEKNNIKIKLQDLIQILKQMIKYHALITSVSTESSDKYVEHAYKDLMNNIPNLEHIKNNIPKILLIFAYGDVIGVDESVMNIEKYNRIKEGYNFFEAVTQNRVPTRNKEKVAIERICDTVGVNTSKELKKLLNHILEKYEINKEKFINDMYNIKLMKYAGSLMKTVNNFELTIRIYYEIFELICEIEEEYSLEQYTIIFIPGKDENDIVEQFENNNFFECVKKMKHLKEDNCTYGNINIFRGFDSEGKYLHIRVV